MNVYQFLQSFVADEIHTAAVLENDLKSRLSVSVLKAGLADYVQSQ
jgi:hypothetical protein